jgi:hypothetical protein
MKGHRAAMKAASAKAAAVETTAAAKTTATVASATYAKTTATVASATSAKTTAAATSRGCTRRQDGNRGGCQQSYHRFAQHDCTP